MLIHLKLLQCKAQEDTTQTYKVSPCQWDSRSVSCGERVKQHNTAQSTKSRPTSRPPQVADTLYIHSQQTCTGEVTHARRRSPARCSTDPTTDAKSCGVLVARRVLRIRCPELLCAAFLFEIKAIEYVIGKLSNERKVSRNGFTTLLWPYYRL